MWLESQVGKGTTFYFNLPYALAPLNRETPGIERELAQAPRAHSKNRKRLLLAESDPLLLRTLRRQLSDYELIEAPAAAEIAALVEQHHPAALVLDEPASAEGAPGEWLAQAPAGLPVIQVAIKGSLRVAQELGIQDYLIKPISRDHLLEAIHAIPRPIQNILIVDDDIQLVELFDRILSSADETFEVLKAFSGAEALQVLKEARPVDLVLLDLRLPDMGGMEVLRAMKARPELADIAVIMASAQNPTELISSNPLSLNVFRGQNASLTETLNCLVGLVEALPPPQGPPIGGGLG
jgi:CheY-like chemotaxis protein